MPMPPSANEAIDRLSPTRCPAGSAAMRQRWAELLFLHWTVSLDMLRPLLPPELELDTFEGRAYVGLVPFTMTGVRPVWSPPFPPLSNFHETNVRTYIHYRGRDPGVWFFSLDAANALAVRIARAWYKLPYHFATMRLERDDSDCIAYASERLWPAPVPAQCKIRYRPTGTPQAATPGTLEHFLAERYILYASAKGKLFQGRVHHTPYPLQTAEVLSLEENLVAAAGIARPDTPPLAHFAHEVRVRVFPLRVL